MAEQALGNDYLPRMAHRVKTVLCFGDSNTWGYCPKDGSRYAFEVRWPGVLQHQLGGEFRVIEEGLNGRTTTHNEAERPLRSGLDVLPVLLESHRPLDWIVVMLGTNDLKKHFGPEAQQIADNLRRICEVIMEHEHLQAHPPRILLCTPTAVNEDSNEVPEWFEGATAVARSLPALMEAAARECGALFTDTAALLQADFADGLHWSEDQHSIIGKAIAETIKL